jgi:dTDP-4-dehydrorhamnose reductase
MSFTDTEMSARILIFGANGQLGQEFRFLSGKYPKVNFLFYERKEADITNQDLVLRLVEQSKCDYIINCAAYTAVDKAENERDTCYLINRDASENLARAALKTSSKLVHFSTDYLYHTYDGFPLREDSPASPQGVYASSKLAGEEAIRSLGASCMILRTSWVISGFGNNFVKTMLRLGGEKDFINVVNDQYGTPTYTRDLAMAVLEIIRKKNDGFVSDDIFCKTYNYSSEGITTWYEMADEIIRFSKSNCKVNPVKSTEYQTVAQRPHWSVLSKQKIKQDLGIEIPHWYDALQRCLKENF